MVVSGHPLLRSSKLLPCAPHPPCPPRVCVVLTSWFTGRASGCRGLRGIGQTGMCEKRQSPEEPFLDWDQTYAQMTPAQDGLWWEHDVDKNRKSPGRENPSSKVT